MKKPLFAAVVGAALWLTPMLAWASPAATTNTPANDPNRVVCKQGQAPVGSRIPGPRICHTQHEWDQMEQDAQHTVTTIEMNNNHVNMPGGG